MVAAFPLPFRQAIASSVSRIRFCCSAAGTDLVFIKRLIAGFVPHTRAEVFEAIKGLKSSKCPFANLPESRNSPHGVAEDVMRKCVWLKAGTPL